MRTSILVLTLVCTAVIPSLAAQDFAPAAVTTRPTPAQLRIDDEQSSDSPALHHRVFSALGSAALGAGIGFFASQLIRSDWQDGPGQRQLNRPLWAIVGGSLGFTLGFSFPLSPGIGSVARVAPPLSGGRVAITHEELARATVSDAYELVLLFRPHWLIERPSDTIRGTAGGTIRVYLDDFLLGGADQLRQINAQTIETIRFVSASAATTRWGVGHSYGAIQVITID